MNFWRRIFLFRVFRLLNWLECMKYSLKVKTLIIDTVMQQFFTLENSYCKKCTFLTLFIPALPTVSPPADNDVSETEVTVKLVNRDTLSSGKPVR